MCGSGGGFPPFRGTPQDIEDQVEAAKNRTADADYERDVCDSLSQQLREYNQRDSQLINDRLAEVRELVEEYLDASIDLRFGGSVDKHTYVNGLSDVDSLMLLKEGLFAAESPQQMLQEFERLLRDTLDTSIKVERGQLAITLTYEDGTEAQLLPAIKTATGVRIASSDGGGWSNVIHPDRFAGQLTKINQDRGGRVVPTIKLAKGAIDSLGLGSQLRGHHVEVMAVRAFENYTGPLNSKAMLHHFFERASSLVRGPIQDSTGQSVYVDARLGPANSPQRQSLSDNLGRIAERMRDADASRSVSDWLDCLGE